jgi:hypothetical protein
MVKMADFDVRGNVFGFVDKRNGRGAASRVTVEDVNLLDVTTMKARLAALDAAYYTATRLNQMTINDMVYAIRVKTADVAGF